MNKRRRLTITVWIFVLIGSGTLIAVFLSTMQPSVRASVGLPRVDLSSVKIGEFAILSAEPHYAYHSESEIKYAVLRLSDGSAKVWRVPVKKDSVLMPDIHWWRPFYPCESFGPRIVDGLVDQTSKIECRDVSIPSEWWAKAWQWNLDGKAVGVEGIDDLDSPKGIFQGDYFVLGKSS